MSRRRLARELRRLRADAGLTIADVAKRLECSAGKVSRIENGVTAAHPTDVAVMLDLYGTAAPERAALLDLARSSRRRAWWHEYAPVVPANSSRFFGLEDGAAVIDQHVGGMIPGLLQTEAYARAIISSLSTAPDADVERRIELRLRRQQLLTRADPPRLHVLLDEAALHREVGGRQVWRGQLERLEEAALTPHVVVQIMPFTVGSYPALGVPFTVFAFDDPADAQVAYVEQLTTNTLVDSPAEVGLYSAAFAESSALGLDPDRSIDLIRSVLR